jgi:homoserine O-succinyltransferase
MRIDYFYNALEMRNEIMPVRVQNDLPAREKLENEHIFVMDYNRSNCQDIRPVRIGFLNLMPQKEDTELQILRLLSNTPIQIDIVFITLEDYPLTTSPTSYTNRYYQPFHQIKNQGFDGLIISGAPFEALDFEDTPHWDEFRELLDWTKTNVTSTLCFAWSAQAGLYHHYGVDKHPLSERILGVFPQHVRIINIPLVRGLDDIFPVPVTRMYASDEKKIYKDSRLSVLAGSAQTGPYLISDETGSQIFVLGNPEYDRLTFDQMYKKERDTESSAMLPENYYPFNNPDNRPLMTWRSGSNTLITNWINYYVYQMTTYEKVF